MILRVNIEKIIHLTKLHQQKANIKILYQNLKYILGL